MRATASSPLTLDSRAIASALDEDARVVAVAKLDPWAFAPHYARCLDPIYRYCYRRLGHPEAAADAAAATVLSHLFPDDPSNLLERAEQAQQSRLWAGIHFPIDNEMGALGRAMIGRLVVVRPWEDGAA